MNVIKEVIERNWFQTIPEQVEKGCPFDVDVESFSKEAVKELVGINNNIFPSKHELHLTVDSQKVDKRLENFLYVIMLSEYYLDNLLYYSMEIRKKEIKNISNRMSMKSDDVEGIYRYWRKNLRQKLMN